VGGGSEGASSTIYVSVFVQNVFSSSELCPSEKMATYLEQEGYIPFHAVE
jgi:hypothetical protein